MRRLLLLGLVLAATANAQTPFLDPADAAATLDGAVARGFVADSAAAAVRGCMASGVRLSRSALVQVVADGICRQAGGGWCRPFGPPMTSVTEQRPPGRPPLSSWADSLASLGLVRPAELDLARAYSEPYRRLADSLAVPPEAALGVLTVLPQIVAAGEALDPDLLAADSEAWVESGAMTAAGRERLLDAAGAGRLPTVGPITPYLRTASPIGRPLDRATDPDALDPVWLRDATAALGQALGTPLRLDTAWVETRTHTVGYDEPYTFTSQMLGARIDGQTVRRRVVLGAPADGVADVLNQVLRERRSPVRVGVALVLTDAEVLEGQAYLVALTRPQLGALEPGLEELRPPRAGVYAHLQALAARGARGPARSAAQCGVYAHLQALAARGDLSRDCQWLAFQSAGPFLESEPVRWAGEAPRFDDAGLRTDSVSATFRAMAAAGLFRPSRADTLAADYLASGAWSSHPSHLLYALPDDVVWPFSWEATEVLPEYVTETHALARLTRGTWAPDSVYAEPVREDRVAYGFRVGGQHYHADLALSGDWFDSDFLRLVLRSVEETVPGGRFYWGDTAHEAILFLTDEQARALKRLPPFAELAPLTVE